MIQFKACIISIIFLLGSMSIGVHSKAVFPESALTGLNQELEDARVSLVRYRIATAILGTFLGTIILFAAVAVSGDKPTAEKVSKKHHEDIDTMNKRVTTLEELVKGEPIDPSFVY